jgi:hypothetical protein
MLAWSRGGLAGRLALGINAVAFIFVGDLPWAILMNLAKILPGSHGGISERVMIMIQVFPIPLALLAMGIFYLWLYIRWFPESRALAEPASGSAQSPSPI